MNASFEQNTFVGLSTRVYENHLALVAKEVYFVEPPEREANTLVARTVVDRVFLR